VSVRTADVNIYFVPFVSRFIEGSLYTHPDDPTLPAGTLAGQYLEGWIADALMLPDGLIT
jgi:hypothetical protein